MKKFFSTLMVSAAMVVMISPLSAQNGCEWEPGLETVIYGRCIPLLEGPNIPGGDYCDTVSELPQDCTKSNFWY